MDQTYNIAVIIPVFNAEKTIERCLDSVTSQTYKSINIVCVDDGSGDGSLEILKRYADNDNRIHVIHKSNGGVSSARNAGLNRIDKCEYVCFIDADDTVDKNYLEMLAMAAYDDVDIVVSGSRHFRDGCVTTCDVCSGTYSIDKVKKNFYELGGFGSLIGKLYKYDSIGNTIFDENLKTGEDLIFNLNLFNKINKIKYIQYSGYNVHENNESLTNIMASQYSPFYDIDYHNYWVTRLRSEKINAGLDADYIKIRDGMYASIIMFQMLKNLFAKANPYDYSEKIQNIKKILNYEYDRNGVLTCKKPLSRKTNCLIKCLIRIRNAHIAYLIIKWVVKMQGRR